VTDGPSFLLPGKIQHSPGNTVLRAHYTFLV
jgi:hypothetical protein